MSYGLYDGDLHLYPQVPFFNLELMKYSTYYKQRRQIVAFSPRFEPTYYSKYLIRQDYPSKHPYSMQYKNIVYGGRAFDGENYQPLPLDIELCRPDTSLYNKIETKIVCNKETKDSFSIMRHAEHVRLSLDGKTINPKWDKQLRLESDNFGLILHDYDLGQIDGVYDLVADNLSEIINNKNGARIGMKFPMQVNTEIDLLKWLQFPPLNQYYSLQYNGILTTDHVEELKENRKLSAAQEQVVINITKNITYEDFVTTGIVKIFKSILDLRRHQLVFPLIYDRTFFTDKRWIDVLKLLDFFITHIRNNIRKDYYYTYKVPYETFYGCIKKELNKTKYGHLSYFSKEPVQRAFQFVREHNYELFKMFYEYTGEEK